VMMMSNAIRNQNEAVNKNLLRKVVRPLSQKQPKNERWCTPASLNSQPRRQNEYVKLCLAAWLYNL